jgi:hypothetical protein
VRKYPLCNEASCTKAFVLLCGLLLHSLKEQTVCSKGALQWSSSLPSGWQTNAKSQEPRELAPRPQLLLHQTVWCRMSSTSWRLAQTTLTYDALNANIDISIIIIMERCAKE